MRFISHLDLNRTIARAFRRAKLPIAYSEGFNPRPKLVFGLNLSIGAESICEILDTQLTHQVPFDEIITSLNKSLPENLVVYDVYTPVMPLKNIAFSEYMIEIPYSTDISDKINKVFTPPVMILKHTKSSESITDISPNILKIQPEYSDSKMTITAVITSGNNDYLNPEYIVKVICEHIDSGISNIDYRIIRKKVFDSQNNVFI